MTPARMAVVDEHIAGENRHDLDAVMATFGSDGRLLECTWRGRRIKRYAMPSSSPVPHFFPRGLRCEYYESRNTPARRSARDGLPARTRFAMNSDDEAELARLTTILRSVSETPAVLANADQLEALQKAALALILIFLRGDRAELDDFMERNDQSEPAGVSVEDVLFHMRDPENVAKALRENSALHEQIASRKFSHGSMGQLLQDALRESRKRAEAGNVSPLKKPPTK